MSTKAKLNVRTRIGMNRRGAVRILWSQRSNSCNRKTFGHQRQLSTEHARTTIVHSFVHSFDRSLVRSFNRLYLSVIVEGCSIVGIVICRIHNRYRDILPYPYRRVFALPKIPKTGNYSKYRFRFGIRYFPFLGGSDCDAD